MKEYLMKESEVGRRIRLPCGDGADGNHFLLVDWRREEYVKCDLV